jgi:PAS domain S-box-containing protein
MNLMDRAALVVDPRRNQIFAVNTHLIKLTAYTQTEILSSNLSSLFTGISVADLTNGEKHDILLNRHTRDPLPIVAQAFPIDAAAQQFIILLVPQVQYQQQQAESLWEEKFHQAYLTLASLTTLPDLNTALSTALETGKFLLRSEILCIYQLDNQFPQLKQTATTETGENPLLPATLPSSTLVRMKEPQVWAPGKRVSSDLHRIARISNMSYLSTVSLGQDSAWLGLLVVADLHNPPHEKIAEMLDLLGISISSAIQHFLLVSNLYQTFNEHNNALVVRDSILSNTLEGVIILKNDLSILEMNPTAELMLGYATEEVEGQQIDNILIGTESLSSALKTALGGVPTHNLGNVTLHRRNGQPFLGHIQTIPVLADTGLLNIVIMLRDVSENEQIRVRTQQLEQRALLGEVMAIFAHEVRNPINNISTGLQLLSMRTPPDTPDQELLGRLEHDCSRLTHLMESVLSFSRQQEYRLEPSDIDNLLRRILDRWRPRLAKANVQTYYQVDPGTPLVIGDTRALEQVFTNLINNSIQAMKDGGTLSVKVTRPVENVEIPQVEITVSDNGPGIPDEIKDHIFEPFMTTNPQGTGLGLAITKRIVVAHKGSIYVNSFPGGTVFHIFLPASTGENS